MAGVLRVQAGLSALKTPQSLAESCSREDPLHLPAFRALAQGLPFAKHVHSKLVCAVTKEIIDEHNPPMVRALGCACDQLQLWLSSGCSVTWLPALCYVPETSLAGCSSMMLVRRAVLSRHLKL